MLDKIVEVGNKSRNQKGKEFESNMIKKNTIPSEKVVPPEKKTMVLMVDHIPQDRDQHVFPHHKIHKHLSWRCTHYGRYGHVWPNCYKIYGYPQSYSKPRLKRNNGNKVQERMNGSPKLLTRLLEQPQ